MTVLFQRADGGDAWAAEQILPQAREFSGIDGFRGINARDVPTEVCAIVGEKDRAIAELKALLQVPRQANVHELRVLPVFQNRRGDPRFEALLADPKNHAPLF
jgi:hypothetical protein